MQKTRNKVISIITRGTHEENRLQYDYLYIIEHYKHLTPNYNDKVYEIRAEKGNTIITETILKYEALRGTEIAIEVIRMLNKQKTDIDMNRAKAMSKLRSKRLNYHYIKR